MKLFARKEKQRKNVQNFMTTMKDLGSRAEATDKTGPNDPAVLFDLLHEAFYILSNVNKQKVTDPEEARLAYATADKVLNAYSPGYGLIEMTRMHDIVDAQAEKFPGCDFETLITKHQIKIERKGVDCWTSRPAVV